MYVNGCIIQLNKLKIIDALTDKQIRAASLLKIARTEETPNFNMLLVNIVYIYVRNNFLQVLGLPTEPRSIYFRDTLLQ
jgi:hypothetical protein